MPILLDFLDAIPTAELEPITADYVRNHQSQLGAEASSWEKNPNEKNGRTDSLQVQSDEVDMQMSYLELSRFGTLRKVDHLGPYGMFLRLLEEWGGEGKLSPREIAHKVKLFFHFYQINRHKQTVATPAYHAESYSPDDHRFDLRPFLYPPGFESWSFKKIDERVEALEQRQKRQDAAKGLK